MSIEAIQAQEELKFRLSRAPVLAKIDYMMAKAIHRKWDSDEGLIIVGVDSSWMGAGWAVYQVQENVKHPAIFGSCTFNECEQNYGQPKTEVYGVFQALKELRHRIWGVHFRLDHDALSLAQMIRQPDDVPNAPILRWVAWIRLFDFEPHHVPATSFKVEDGLSRRGKAPEDSKYEDPIDPEEFLDAYIGSIYGSRTNSSLGISSTKATKFLLDSLYTKLSNPYVRSTEYE